jgi:hypothetical protein
MDVKLADRVMETTTTAGTGAVALAGAVVGYQTFISALGAGQACYYTIAHQTLPAEWEVGIGTLSAGPDTLTRTTVLASSNSGALVAFSAGTKNVFCSAAAAAFAPRLLVPLRPEGAVFPNANFPQLVKNAGTNWTDYTLDFDTTTEEAAFWYTALPPGLTPRDALLDVYSRQAAAVTGTVAWKVTTLTRGDGDAWDTAGVVDNVIAATVKGTAGQVLRQQKALTLTGWGADRALLIKLARDVANDTVAEDAKLIGAMLRVQ